jgi:hypothetical protein
MSFLNPDQSLALAGVLDYLRKDALGTGQLDERAVNRLSALWPVLGYRSQIDFINHLRDEPILSLLNAVSLLSGQVTPVTPTVQDFGVSWTPADLDLGSLIGLFATSGPSLVGVQSLTIRSTTNQEGYDFESCSDLESVSFPNLSTVPAGKNFIVSYNPELKTISFGSLVTIDRFDIHDNPNLITISLPTLVSINTVAMQNNSALSSVDMSSLTSVGTFNMFSSTALLTLSLPSLTAITAGLDCDSSSLVNVSFPHALFTNGIVIDFSACALSSTSINHILARGVANPAFTTGALFLDGGTNAAPSGQGIADKATLIGRGVTVNTN